MHPIPWQMLTNPASRRLCKCTSRLSALSGQQTGQRRARSRQRGEFSCELSEQGGVARAKSSSPHLHSKPTSSLVFLSLPRTWAQCFPPASMPLPGILQPFADRRRWIWAHVWESKCCSYPVPNSWAASWMCSVNNSEGLNVHQSHSKSFSDLDLNVREQTHFYHRAYFFNFLEFITWRVSIASIVNDSQP